VSKAAQKKKRPDRIPTVEIPVESNAELVFGKGKK
jgi:hypothetical protein